jgi:hypothetical protein
MSIAKFSPATTASTDFGVANQKKNDILLDSQSLLRLVFEHEVCAPPVEPLPSVRHLSM